MKERLITGKEKDEVGGRKKRRKDRQKERKKIKR